MSGRAIAVLLFAAIFVACSSAREDGPADDESRGVAVRCPAVAGTATQRCPYGINYNPWPRYGCPRTELEASRDATLCLHPDDTNKYDHRGRCYRRLVNDTEWG